MSLPLEERLARIQALVLAIEASPDAPVRERARELARVLLEVHAAAIARMLGSADKPLVDAWIQDELIASLLLLHGLHPQPLAERAARALESVRPTLRSHHGDVELVAVVDGEVRLRLTGACDGCPSSTATLRGAIEAALDRFVPDRIGMCLVGAPAMAGRAAPGECVSQRSGP